MADFKTQDGKYTITNLYTEHPVEVIRNGEPWLPLHVTPMGKLILDLVAEIEDLRDNNTPEQIKLRAFEQVVNLINTMPIDLWATYGGADREQLEVIQSWLLEKSADGVNFSSGDKANPHFRALTIAKFSQMIMGRTANRAATDLYNFLFEPKVDLTPYFTDKEN